MRVTIKIDTDNAAFEGDTATETARILRELANRFDYAPDSGETVTIPLRDLNGNICGSCKVQS